MDKFFPLFTDISNKHVVIIGNNEKSQEKIEKLKDYNPTIEVLSEKTDIEQYILSTLPKLVIVADEDLVNVESIYNLCVGNRIEINTVDNPKYCTFIFPSIASSETLTVGVSTSGLSPTVAIKIREDIEKMIPTEIDAIIEWLGQLREVMKKREDVKLSCIRKVYRLLADRAFEYNRPLTMDETEAIITMEMSEVL